MSASKTIKKIMLDKNISVKVLAEKLGMNAQVLSNKLYRDTFSYNDYVLIANILECDVKTISRDNNFEYINEYEEKTNKKESEEQWVKIKNKA